VNENLSTARRRLLQIVAELKAMRTRLREVVAILPAPPEGGRETDAEEMDLATEVRSVVDCVLQDSLGPALRDLQAVADLLPARSQGRKKAP
jgi:hypothetical protein